jgi:transposase-like protein
MKCPKCNSENVEVNGLYYHCLDCDELDDSTFSMIMETTKRIEAVKE